MATNEQEIEVKFMLQDLPGLEKRLLGLGARLHAPRVRETNLRFDTPGRELSQGGRVLRLRQDARAVMTYKGPSQPGQEVAVRQEIEFEVSDLDAAGRLLEALGYQVMVMYEKFRAEYHLRDLVVVLDELPYGHFSEIEGPDAESIQRAAAELGLDWEARCADSYLYLFERLRKARGLPPSDLSFEALKGMEFSPADFGLTYADKS